MTRACLDDAAALDFVGGQLEAASLREAESHVDSCASCRDLVAVLAGGAPLGVNAQSGSTREGEGDGDGDGDGDARHANSPRDELAVALDPVALVGTTLDRYRILDVLGAGAMGIVYAARDLELDRMVALKLLRPGASAAVEARTMREAQAMARLAHPNVVAIHSVHRTERGIVIAMEHVPGTTLGAWLRSAKRSTEAIASAFVEAGRGLVAAHAANLVHRDFKPENVLVGADGRVRVTDFGLVREAGTHEAEGRAFADARDVARGDTARWLERETALESAVRTRGLVGTPAYMAPEQLRCEPATERSDQFAFAVALYEALAGTRPFRGATVDELVASIARGAPELGQVPRPLQRAVARALALRPEDRHASMTVFVSAIESGVTLAGTGKGRRASRLRWAVGGLAAALVASAAVAVNVGAAPGLVRGSSAAVAEADPCEPSLERAALWNDDVRARVGRAFHLAAGDEGRDAARRVSAHLDARASVARAEHRATCEATHVQRAQSPAMLDARMHCLERHSGDFAALVSSFEKADAATVRGAVPSAIALGDPRECRNVTSLAAMDPLPSDASKRAAIGHLERRLAAARTALAAGRTDDSDASARALVLEAEALGHRPLVAEARLFEAKVARAAGDFDASAKAARGALAIAEGARADAIAARAWIEILASLAAQGRALRVIEDGDLAAAVLARLGDPPALTSSRLEAVGAARIVTGDLDGAERDLGEARRLREAAFGPRSLAVAESLSSLGSLARARGNLDEAVRLHEEAIGIERELLGEGHPNLAVHHHNVAGVLRLAGKRDAALERYARALEIERTRLGESHPSVGLTENSIAIAWLDAGRIDRAREHLATARRILEAKGHPDRALVRVNLGIADAREREPERALEHFTTAIDIVRAAAGADAERLASILDRRADAALDAGRAAEASRDRKEALRILALHSDSSVEAAKLARALEAKLAGKTPRAPTAKAPPIRSTDAKKRAPVSSSETKTPPKRPVEPLDGSSYGAQSPRR